MNLRDIVRRIQPPSATEGSAIPWADPEFSARMLKNHLSQDHDWASRRRDLIERQAKWTMGRLAPGARVLDLACGPGFYTQILARRGFPSLGVDISPASVEYARQEAAKEGLPAEYVHSDILEFTPEPEAFDAVLFIFGEFNNFSEVEARKLLAACGRALRPGGQLILEGYTYETARDTGRAPASWWTCAEDEGILSARPHLCLQENHWDEPSATAVTRYFTFDEATGEIRMFRSTMTGYTRGGYGRLLAEAGFEAPKFLSRSEWPVGGPFEGQLLTLVTKKLKK